MLPDTTQYSWHSILSSKDHMTKTIKATNCNHLIAKLKNEFMIYILIIHIQVSIQCMKNIHAYVFIGTACYIT